MTANSSTYNFNPKDGCTLSLKNVSIHLQDYMVSQPRRLQSDYMEIIHVTELTELLAVLIVQAIKMGIKNYQNSDLLHP
jgi:hypothetical protein